MTTDILIFRGWLLRGCLLSPSCQIPIDTPSFFNDFVVSEGGGPSGPQNLISEPSVISDPMPYLDPLGHGAIDPSLFSCGAAHPLSIPPPSQLFLLFRCFETSDSLPVADKSTSTRPLCKSANFLTFYTAKLK